MALQIAATAFVEFYTFCFQHALLLIGGQHNSSRRAGALSVDYSMPGSLVVGTMHYKTNRSRRVTFAQNFGKLAVGHYFAAWD